MNILCIDTSTPICRIAISITRENTAGFSFVEQEIASHSQVILEAIQQCLLSSSVSLEDIDLVTVSRGPGSFTGIRVGIAAAQAFAYGLNLPVIGVSSMAILARAAVNSIQRFDHSNKNFYLLCANDARMSQLYYALFNGKKLDQPVIEESVGNIDAMAAEIKLHLQSKAQILVAGNANDLIRKDLEKNNIKWLESLSSEQLLKAMVDIAKRVYEHDKLDRCKNRFDQLQPLYVRNNVVS